MRDRTPAWLWSVIVAGYTGTVVLMLAPLSNYAEFGSAIGWGDPKLLAWTFAWTSHAILTGAPLFDANVFYPAHPGLAFAEHHIGVGIFALPVYALTGNPVLAYSTLRIFALTMNAVAMHVFAWRWLRGHGPALVAGLIFGVSTTRLIYSSHVPLASTWWLPLLLLALDRWLERRDWRWMAATAACFTWQALTGWYLAVMAALAVAVFVGWRLVWSSVWPPSAESFQRGRRGALQAVAGALLVGIIVWPFATPYLALAGHAEVTPEAARLYSADVGAYLIPPDYATVGPVFTALTGQGTRPVSYERMQYLGWLALLLGTVGSGRVIWLAVRRGAARERGQEVLWGGYFLLLGLIALALSVGPSVGGQIPRPFDLISHAPVVGMFRVPARFAVLVTLALAGLSALAVAQLQIWGRRQAVVATAVLAPLLLLDWAVLPPADRKPQPDPTPAIYALIPGLNPRALVSLPAYRRKGAQWPTDADYMLYSTTHWRPIVNGYGKSEPPGYHWVVGAVDAFPGPNSAIRMRALGIDVVVLHRARYRDQSLAAEILAEARTSPDFELVSQMGEDYLFRLRPAR